MYSIRLPEKTKEKKKKIAVRKPVTQEKYKPVKVKLCQNPNYLYIDAYLYNDTFAHFSDREDPQHDNFYQILSDLTSQHKEIINDDEVNYHTCFSSNGFKFKSAKKNILRCYDKNSKLVMSDKFHSKLCKFKLRVKPYDITNADGRLCGLTIYVSEIKQI